MKAIFMLTLFTTVTTVCQENCYSCFSYGSEQWNLTITKHLCNTAGKDTGLNWGNQKYFCEDFGDRDQFRTVSCPILRVGSLFYVVKEANCGIESCLYLGNAGLITVDYFKSHIKRRESRIRVRRWKDAVVVMIRLDPLRTSIMVVDIAERNQPPESASNAHNYQYGRLPIQKLQKQVICCEIPY
ncbi:hypothetical protein P154DRAFT_570220 [Amniculicola lignicola CBS 123094]|uniref:Cyanovirin-N domain-containing protein n=1 Tax=Amniculicola lignicola CBS 123094 TaxID=1392246 RepID=A0A6A5X1Y3_9PLEO|nr:hypothetical protein P154DRAFT_570220 [Amniculicola lignicola CBS 123094]